MGACNIEFTLKGQKTESEINKAFEQQQLDDREYNGPGCSTKENN